MSGYSDEFLKAMENEGGTLANGIVKHFGQPLEALHALETGVAVGIPGEVIRIQVSGRDRASFLHNFCTNDIKAMSPGKACEAFFVDVKARIIAHGYVAAERECHEIWLLSNDSQTLLNHLERYIITEDVALSLVEEQSVLVVAGPQAGPTMAKYTGIEAPGDDSFYRSDEFATLAVRWNELPTVFVSCSQPMQAWAILRDAGAVPAGHAVTEHHRILEGFPVVGVDVTADNLAPEADRIEQAISYRKGCYLGQEPIARLDALGHVNRKMYRCTFNVAGEAQVDAELPTITSQSQVAEIDIPGLIQLNVKSVATGAPVRARTTDGVLAEVVVSD